MIRTLVVEDEQRAARQLQRMLEAMDTSFEILGVIDSIQDTEKWLNSAPPLDLIFMDIQLADGLSFEIFQHINIETPVIFTTAFDQYAIQAFKVNSVDYLLKPIKQSELSVAIHKFKKSNTQSIIDPFTIKNLLGSLKPKVYRSGFLVKAGHGYIQINATEVIYFYSEDSLSFLECDQGRFIVDEPLDQIEASIDPAYFFRINRSQIVAKASIAKIAPYLNHRLKLTIDKIKDHEFIVSRARTSDFKNWLNQ
ncbi:LytR/AlgR family response regulator transcription factor [Portibacter marinus]|uniref:LytR/AlgR family response regulator transcription factor n=1 Tax=Portibacter marinus TaxID=2898660 RepID=UPI001F1A7BEB|nr:LytTR family DNA-binding domain-containing protein [Portibacter marinus]